MGPAEASIGKLRKFLSNNFGDPHPGLTSTATSILKGLRKFNFSAFGFGAGLELADPRQERGS